MFVGDNCSVDINECASVPCQHNSTCVNTFGGYLCNCTGGYLGPNCAYPDYCFNKVYRAHGFNGFFEMLNSL